MTSSSPPSQSASCSLISFQSRHPVLLSNAAAGSWRRRAWASSCAQLLFWRASECESLCTTILRWPAKTVRAEKAFCSTERKCRTPGKEAESSLNYTTGIPKCRASKRGSRRSKGPSPSSALTSCASAAASDLNPLRSAISYSIFLSRSYVTLTTWSRAAAASGVRFLSDLR